jgi:hypothetical protein
MPYLSILDDPGIFTNRSHAKGGQQLHQHGGKQTVYKEHQLRWGTMLQVTMNADECSELHEWQVADEWKPR